MKKHNLSVSRCIVSFLVICILAFTTTACIKVLPKTTAGEEDTSAPPAIEEPGNDEGWEINEDNTQATQPPASVPPTATTAPVTAPSTTPAASTPACDLKIQPATLNAAPGVYTFTAISPSATNALYQWDIGGLISQSGPQNTFTVDMNSPGSGTISVTQIINGRATCKATSTVNIVQTVVTPQCDLKIQPATLTANLATYTFWATTSNTNALFLWDINGYQQAYGPEPSFSVTFTSAGTVTVSVTMVINGVPVCKASSRVNIVPKIIK